MIEKVAPAKMFFEFLMYVGSYNLHKHEQPDRESCYTRKDVFDFVCPRQFKTAITWKLTFPPADSQWAISEKSTKII